MGVGTGLRRVVGRAAGRVTGVAGLRRAMATREERDFRWAAAEGDLEAVKAAVASGVSVTAVDVVRWRCGAAVG